MTYLSIARHIYQACLLIVYLPVLGDSVDELALVGQGDGEDAGQEDDLPVDVLRLAEVPGKHLLQLKKWLLDSTLGGWGWGDRGRGYGISVNKTPEVVFPEGWSG